MSGLQELRELIAAEGGLLAGALGTGESSAPDGAGSDVVTEAVREGYLLHYDRGRILDPEDADLALLAGDRCYAIGLELLAERGDLDAVRDLATLIAEGARAQAGGDLEAAEELWQESAARASKSA